MYFALFLLLFIMYLLLGIIISLVINWLIEDGCIKTNLDSNKYKLAIVSFWPIIPFILIILGFWQLLTFIKDCVLEVRKK